GMTKQYFDLRARQESQREKLSSKAAELTALTQSLFQSAERAERVTQDLSTAQERQAQAVQQLSHSRQLLENAREDIVAANNSIEGYRLREKTRVQKRDTLRKQVSDSSVSLQTVASKRKMLEEMQRDFEGYSKAVRTVMQESKRGGLRGVRGPVSMLIRTDDANTIAIETALGSAMQQIVVNDAQDAKAAIRMLKRIDGGRATFLPISVIQARPLNERGVENCTGFVGIAADLVACEQPYRNIISNLLGRTVIASDMDAAIAIADKFSHRFRIVTLDGQIINAGGSMTGGSASGSAGILSRANEIARLMQKQTQMQSALTALEAELSEAERLTREVTFELLAQEGKLRTAQDEALRLEGEEKQYAVLAEAIAQAIASSDEELSSLSARSKDEQTRSELLRENIAALQQELERLEAALGVVSDGQSVAAEQSNRLNARMTELRMQRAALDAEKNTAKESVGRLQELRAAMDGDRAQRQALIAMYEKETEELQAQMASLQQSLEECNTHALQQRESLKTALEQRTSIEANRSTADRDAQTKNRQILGMERESARLENKKSTAEMEEKQIIDRLWESYELTRSSAIACAAPIDSVTSASKQVADLKRKIAALGTPNLGAIEEFARVNERYEYLTAQRDDVLTSKRDLEGIIRDITAQMTEIFLSEFGKINTYFGQTFVEMFGGGRASLELEDTSEPLSCGVEIRVQPPGKQLKTITLLSGGEKAFVAIALYFAILKVRPTPFCMLDEIDAALDDTNVARFANYLRSLAEKTQFIVITHRRGTMEASDVLYGVTMQEQGISKILHLDMNKVTQDLGVTD
ncbi:MAG: chromosome segregation protein SMC, partial [Oscillospiraceae bacterium]|nr:chromosome segregation protein SMC [Oscillospiraceae bacterium]